MKISNKDFVHMHSHTEGSQFDGLAKTYDLAMLARERGHPAVAITDHGTVGSWIKFLLACSATKDKDGNPIPYDPIKPILGEEFYLCRRSVWKGKEELETRRAEAKKLGKKLDPRDDASQPDGRKGNRHLNIFARNWEGYQNLCTLSQKAWVDGYAFKDPRIDLEMLAKHSKGLMIGTACLSSFINANLLHDRYDKALQGLGMLADMVGKENVFLEAMYHGYASQRLILPDIYKLSVATGIQVCASNDCHYLHKDQARSQEVAMCIATQNCVTNPKHMKHPYDELYFKTAEEMAKVFRFSPQSLYNTVAMAERIDTDDIVKNLFGGMRLPKFKLTDGYDDPMKFLVHLAKQGMRDKGWDKSPRHIERLKIELGDVKVAKDMNNYDFATYFLIVWDYINYALKEKIVVGCGRGSAAGSVLMHALGIVYGPDPLEYGLLWERFLGFGDLRFIRAEDFGFSDEVKSVLEQNIIDETEDDLDEDREVDQDFGGVDRY